MRKLLVFTLPMFLLVACSNNSAKDSVTLRDGDLDIEGTVLEQSDSVGEAEDADDVKESIVSATMVANDELSFFASSVLEDKTGIGFNYESEMINDRDFSTSWCVAAGDKERMISINFPESFEIHKIGVVPGFARDETIFFQNNRVKDLKVLFGEGKEAKEKVFTLKDEYGMQFIDLEGVRANSLQFVIEDSYVGSKYSDICISEIDFNSDYVVNSDISAAQNYYEEYKKDFALEPYDIVGAIKLSDSGPDGCSEFSLLMGEREGYGFYDKDLGYSFFGLPVYVTAFINEYGTVGDTMDVKWYREVYDFDKSSGNDGVWELVDYDNDLEVLKSCKGNLYLHVQSNDGVTGPSLGGYRVDFYHDDKFVGREYFAVTQ